MSTISGNASSSRPNPVVKHEPNQPSSLELESIHPSKPVVIGVYGVPGCGKTTLLAQLKEKLGEDSFAFYEG